MKCLGPRHFRSMLGENKDDDKLSAMVLFTFYNHMNLAFIYQNISHYEVGTKITFIFTFNCWTSPLKPWLIYGSRGSGSAKNISISIYQQNCGKLRTQIAVKSCRYGNETIRHLFYSSELIFIYIYKN